MASAKSARRSGTGIILGSAIFLLAMFFPLATASAPNTSPESAEFSLVCGNSLKGSISVYYEGENAPDVPLNASSGIFEGLMYKSLIACLAKYESGLNSKAVGDNGLAKGLLQYHEATWNFYCQGDIWDAKTQVKCADEMLKEDFYGNIRHWTTSPLCI